MGCEKMFSNSIIQKHVPVFARVRIQASQAFAQKRIPQENVPACIGVVSVGILKELEALHHRISREYLCSGCH